jgi:hypothetical protein
MTLTNLTPVGRVRVGPEQSGERGASNDHPLLGSIIHEASEVLVRFSLPAPTRSQDPCLVWTCCSNHSKLARGVSDDLGRDQSITTSRKTTCDEKGRAPCRMGQLQRTGRAESGRAQCLAISERTSQEHRWLICCIAPASFTHTHTPLPPSDSLHCACEFYTHTHAFPPGAT